MKTALIRADGSQSIGLGHLVRCLTLAQALRKRGWCVVFMVRRNSAAVKTLGSSGFKAEWLPSSLSEKEDGRLLRRTAARLAVSALIIDRNNPDTRGKKAFKDFLKEARSVPAVLVALDGLGHTEFRYDVLVLPFYGVKEMCLKFHPGTRTLLGAKYFLLGKDFKGMRRKSAKKGVPSVLITTGGADPARLTEKMLEALRGTKYLFRATVVCGPAFGADRVRRIRGLVKLLPKRHSVSVAPRRMQPLIRSADAAVISGGLTKYELAACGVPALSLSQSEEEARWTERFSKAGSLVHLGEGRQLSALRIRSSFEHFLTDTAGRGSMAKKGPRLVDGRGAERVVLEIEKAVKRKQAS